MIAGADLVGYWNITKMDTWAKRTATTLRSTQRNDSV
jgi:hypothetical protein